MTAALSHPAEPYHGPPDAKGPPRRGSAAARKTGELSKKIERISAKGNQHTGKVVTPDDAEIPTKTRVLSDASPECAEKQSKGKVLKEAGISTQQASDWERLAAIPEGEFEAALAYEQPREGGGMATKANPPAGGAGGPLRLSTEQDDNQKITQNRPGPQARILDFNGDG